MTMSLIGRHLDFGIVCNECNVDSAERLEEVRKQLLMPNSYLGKCTERGGLIVCIRRVDRPIPLQVRDHSASILATAIASHGHSSV